MRHAAMNFKPEHFCLVGFLAISQCLQKQAIKVNQYDWRGIYSDISESDRRLSTSRCVIFFAISWLMRILVWLSGDEEEKRVILQPILHGLKPAWIDELLRNIGHFQIWNKNSATECSYCLERYNVPQSWQLKAQCFD
ncbi:hypothetical protein OUZ56_015867 [Daphnia magna]|uniref:Uncharacterized protein n=1 Tax=Daphnia magna TaxID=35525 RepID=A0ABR0ANZ5_9CRUS|nr:hypothetical protein OUZ56_015867 [Daphnia magna]